MLRIALPIVMVLSWCSACAAQSTLELDGVLVRYSGVSERYADAIGRVVSSARELAIDKFQFDMPDTIFVEVQAEQSGNVRLFNDGQDRFSLTVRSESDLAQPSRSGVFHIYGLCHEVAHLAMYRPIREHSWLSYGAAEGWAHYLGSRLVDDVFDREGGDLWPDQYDFRADGMQRLNSQIESGAPSDVVRSADVWKKMVELVGDDGVAEIFAQLGKANVESVAPSKAVGNVLKNSPHGADLSKWLFRHEASLLVKRPKSGFASETISADQLDGDARELAHDDGRQTGKKSTAGGGHAVRFETRGGPAFVTSVRIHGSRYGSARAPNDNFRVWLCDEDFKQIAEFEFPYSKFQRGSPKWVNLKTDPTKVPAKFVVCIGFNPTATKGVYASHDAQSSGNSISGLPGRSGRDFDAGDWMIRTTIEHPKHDFALNPGGAKTPLRVWTDATGEFSVEAEFVRVENGYVVLKKTDGSEIQVAVENLSQADQEFVRRKLPK